MFKPKQTKNANVGTLIGPKTRINGDVEFTGGLHCDGYINGNVKGDSNENTFLSVSQQGAIEGSVIAPNVILNGIVKGDIDATGRVELGEFGVDLAGRAGCRHGGLSVCSTPVRRL